MTDMTRAPLFFVKPTPSRVEGVEYEPFPADGEPVYVTHPAFIYDKGLKIALDAYHLQLALSLVQMKAKNPSVILDDQLPDAKAWLAGKTPIPEQHWGQMKKTRLKWLAKHDHPLDTPIGFQHPDFQPTTAGSVVEFPSTSAAERSARSA